MRLNNATILLSIDHIIDDDSKNFYEEYKQEREHYKKLFEESNKTEVSIDEDTPYTRRVKREQMRRYYMSKLKNKKS